MGDDSEVREFVEAAGPREIVSFSVICRPQSGMDLKTVHERLALNTLDECLPSSSTTQRVTAQLRERGFEVLIEDVNHPSPLVSARGTVELFESTFKVKLVKRVRIVRAQYAEHKEEWFVTATESGPPLASEIHGALVIALVEPPLLIAPLTPHATPGFDLHVPGDIALLTMSSAAHRLELPFGDRATGGNVGVAVVDSGFFPHPFYIDHAYRISRAAPSDTSNPDVDNQAHGTSVIANVFACAPDAQVFGIRIGPNPVLALDLAMTFPIDVISCSWVYNLPDATSLPPIQLAIAVRLLTCIAAGKVVVAGAGNGQRATFPAMMPEVIAVGGVEVSAADAISVWSRSSSFASVIYSGRRVPDVCGLASNILLPVPPDAGQTWRSKPGTSYATPQVAAVCALLRQKDPALTPAQIRNVLFETATDVSAGRSASGDPAVRGPDDATGGGLVNAVQAWQAV
jgi:serine protease AprX